MQQNPYQQNSGNVLKPTKLWQRITAWTLVVGVFVLAIFLFTISYAYEKFTTDEFASYAPIDSAIYFQARTAFWPWDQYSLDKLPYKNFYTKNNLQQYLSKANQTAYVLFSDDQNGLQEAWFFKFKDNIGQDLTLELPYKKIDQKSLVIGSSDKALDKVLATSQGELFSLATQQNLPVKAKSYFRIFISPSSFDQDFLPAKLLSNNFYVTADWENNNWQLEVFSTSRNEKNESLVKNLPKDFQIHFSGVNLKEFINEVLSENTELSNSFSQNQKRFSQIYNFDAKSAIEELVKNNFDITVFNQSTNAFGLDFVLVTKPLNDQALKDFEQLIKIVLAQKMPQKTLRLLPDGSSVTEILASTDAWQWESQGDIRVLVEASLNFELAYLNLEDKFLAASSQKLLENYLSDESFVISRLGEGCNQAIFDSNYIIFNTNNTINNISNYLPTGVLAIGGGKGCIYNIN